MPAATGPGSFVQQQFDDLEANRATNVMYNLLRGAFTQEQIVDIALPQKKGHLIGSTNLEGADDLHGHAASQPLQGSAGPHAAAAWRRRAWLQPVRRQLECAHRQGDARRHRRGESRRWPAQLGSTYSFGITSNGVDLDRRRRGADREQRVLRRAHAVPQQPDRRDQPGVHRRHPGFDIQHILLATDTAYMPAARSRARSPIAASCGPAGRATAMTRAARSVRHRRRRFRSPGTTAGRRICARGSGRGRCRRCSPDAQGAGAGKIGMTTQWLSVMANRRPGTTDLVERSRRIRGRTPWMAANYLGIRHAHFRITLRGWLKGLDKALIAIASALTFILTAMVAMVIYGMAQALPLLLDSTTSHWHRIGHRRLAGHFIRAGARIARSRVHAEGAAFFRFAAHSRRAAGCAPTCCSRC